MTLSFLHQSFIKIKTYAYLASGSSSGELSPSKAAYPRSFFSLRLPTNKITRNHTIKWQQPNHSHGMSAKRIAGGVVAHTVHWPSKSLCPISVDAYKPGKSFSTSGLSKSMVVPSEWRISVAKRSDELWRTADMSDDFCWSGNGKKIIIITWCYYYYLYNIVIDSTRYHVNDTTLKTTSGPKLYKRTGDWRARFRHALHALPIATATSTDTTATTTTTTVTDGAADRACMFDASRQVFRPFTF